MISVEERIELLCKEVAILYFEKKDYDKLAFYLSKDITWVGTGQNEIFLNKKEAICFLKKEQKIFDSPFKILEEWYECKQVNDDKCYVMANIKVQPRIGSIDLPMHTLRFTLVWHLDKLTVRWKIVHAHVSLPNKGGGNSDHLEIHESIREAAYIDSLTKIYNIQGFENEVEGLLTKNPNKQYALIEIGIKNFRFVNRRHSFAVGDKLLKNIAKNLAKTILKDEACGRIEKDNFVMLYHIKSKEQLDKRVHSICERLIDKRLKNQLKVEVLLKAGIYIIKDNREYLQDMLDKTLMAMQSIRSSESKDCYAYFKESMLERQFTNSKILEDAPKAMENDEFELYIQPQFDIKTEKIIAGEVLTRWKLEDGVLRMPDAFIPIFEKSGVILSFDFYMLEKVCKQLREWIDKGIQIYPISINQSRLHIQDKNYIKNFCKIVDKYKIPHHFIAFELTESAFMEDNKGMLKLASHLHEKGFQLAIDDFGTGYAAINLLAEINADILKIDKAFLNDCDHNPRIKIVMKTIITLAHQLKMKVVVEGIETKEQLLFLKNLNCDIGQGFLIGKPIASKEFEKKWIEVKNTKG